MQFDLSRHSDVEFAFSDVMQVLTKQINSTILMLVEVLAARTVVYLGDRIKELLSANQWSGSDTPEF
jgi:hypothetical protein